MMEPLFCDLFEQEELLGVVGDLVCFKRHVPDFPLIRTFINNRFPLVGEKT